MKRICMTLVLATTLLLPAYADDDKPTIREQEFW